MSTKMYYFEVRGIGEPLRMLLSYGRVKFEDVRIPLLQWPAILQPEYKAKSRWGTVPFVEFEGKVLSSSSALLRFFAKRFKLVPEDDYEAALCDEYVDSTFEFMRDLYPLYHPHKPLVLKEKQEKAKKDAIPSFKPKLEVFESIVKANGGKHLVSKSLTWADIYLAFFLDHAHLFLQLDLTDDYPNLKNLKSNVLNTPGIKEYIATRPDTLF